MSHFPRFTALTLLFTLALIGVLPECARAAPARGTADPRSYMHGIEAVPAADGGINVFFSSSGLPPTGPDVERNWTHDVYVAPWHPEDDTLGTPEIFIQKPEAQEPVSVAATTDGHVMVSFEDGWNTENEVDQRYGVYDQKLGPILPYPNNVATGGHSGHVTAVGNLFVVFYSDDWVNGGGVDNLGTGNGVYVKIYDSNGHFQRAVPVVAHKREWWPMLAGSPRDALLLWQQFLPKKTFATLKFALLDPQTGTLTKPVVLHKNIQYYTYKVAYVSALDQFLVTGTTAQGKGFAHMIDHSGRVVATLPCMPPVVREAGLLVQNTMAYTPAESQQLLHLALAPQTITLQAVQASSIPWFTMGSVGLVRNASNLHWVSLTRNGLQEADFDLHAAQPLGGKAACP